MTCYVYRNIPDYFTSGFCAVRHSYDNFLNVLKVVEIVNNFEPILGEHYPNDFDVVIFTGEFRRAIVKKNDGYFSMAIPFQVVFDNARLYFNCDSLGEIVDGRFISIMRNATRTLKEVSFSHEEVIYSIMENFRLELEEAMCYFDVFASILSDDHGYFRFDDDQENANGKIHPRYHFDIFYKNSSSLKIGLDRVADPDCLYALMDGSREKKFLSNG